MKTLEAWILGLALAVQAVPGWAETGAGSIRASLGLVLGGAEDGTLSGSVLALETRRADRLYTLRWQSLEGGGGIGDLAGLLGDCLGGDCSRDVLVIDEVALLYGLALDPAGRDWASFGPAYLRGRHSVDHAADFERWGLAAQYSHRGRRLGRHAALEGRVGLGLNDGHSLLLVSLGLSLGRPD